MAENRASIGSSWLPWTVVGVFLVAWMIVSSLNLFPPSAFPTLSAVGRGFSEEFWSGRLFNDLVASLYRVGIGFGAAVLTGIPCGLWLGHSVRLRQAFSPTVNFLRSLSPLAWMPFAILWFGIGDAPAIFLIFMASFFPFVMATAAAVTSIPSVYFRVAQDLGIRGWELIHRVTFPAILPEVITTMRVTAGLAWLVVVAAEMVAGQDGLGFAIMDARNGLRTDVVVVEMIVIGAIGIIIDRALVGFTRIPSVRWGYER